MWVSDSNSILVYFIGTVLFIGTIRAGCFCWSVLFSIWNSHDTAQCHEMVHFLREFFNRRFWKPQFFASNLCCMQSQCTREKCSIEISATDLVCSCIEAVSWHNIEFIPLIASTLVWKSKILIFSSTTSFVEIFLIMTDNCSDIYL